MNAEIVSHDTAAPDPSGADAPRTIRIGAVSYLNTVPLIEGLEKLDDITLTLAVPSRLITLLLERRLDVALAPIIDAQRADPPLGLVPAGMIGSDGATFTVRLYGARPVEELERIYADTDSRTSVALLRIVLRELYGVSPEIVNFDARERISTSESGAAAEPHEWPEGLLMIGDKVVTDSPPAVRYPHQLDLGEAWKRLTGLPFVYATWMCRTEDVEADWLGGAASLLDRQRRHNQSRIDWIVTRRAADRGWPLDLARDYLGRMLRFDLGDQEREAVERFFDLAAEAGVLDARRPTNWAR